ncbi:MAG: hypothetical protein KTR31_19745 [Myxococcales bacterium]|nr:hypothetical protein [Myxococcales bacterium]
MKIGNVLMTAALVILIPVGLASAYATWSSRPPVEADTEERVRPAKVAAAAVPEAPAKVTYERPMDQLIFDVIERPRGGSDLFAEQPFRVDVQLDANGQHVRLVEVDLDRDGANDERWTVLDGVTREVSEADDGRYDVVTSWSADGWRPLGVQKRTGTPVKRQRPTALIDGLVLGWRGRSLPEGEKLDLVPALPIGVAVFQDEGFDTVNRAHVDLDRDGRIDQIWEITPDEIRRRVSPDDDGTHPQIFRREGRDWVSVDGEGASP